LQKGKVENNQRHNSSRRGGTKSCEIKKLKDGVKIGTTKKPVILYRVSLLNKRLFYLNSVYLTMENPTCFSSSLL
jgi:hypothetical protein